MTKVIPIKKMDIIDKAAAEILATKVHLRIQDCYKPSDPIAIFTVISSPPRRDVLVMFRNILIEEFEYENVEWRFDDFTWDIIISRQNVILL
ncbi:MAG: hypothetical protein AAB471_02080 [Patescibacteria group bacterium]